MLLQNLGGFSLTGDIGGNQTITMEDINTNDSTGTTNCDASTGICTTTPDQTETKTTTGAMMLSVQVILIAFLNFVVAMGGSEYTGP